MKRPVLLIFILLLTGHSYAQYFTLALNLTKGATYYHISSAKASVEQTVNGQKNLTTTTISSRAAFKVTGIRDSVYDIEMRYESLSLSLQSALGNMEFSSAKTGAADASGGLLKDLTAQPVKIVLSRSGNLQSVAGLDELLDHAAPAAKITHEQLAQLKGTFRQSFGAEAFRNNFEIGNPVYPTSQVKKGVIWVTNSQLPGPANVHTVYELRDITDIFYHIHANSDITYPNGQTYIESGGMPVRNNLHGSLSADMVIDKITGWLKQTSITQVISGNTEIKANPNMPAGMYIPVVMRSEILITDIH